MKYFIDFEATQYSNEIISIGCVNENGDTFSSLVRANPKKVTGFITRLTGITRSEVAAAPTSDEVFSQFFDWISKDNRSDFTFYCYGDTDIKFIESNLKRTSSMKAVCALSIIGQHLKDYSKEVKKHYGLIKNIKLIKLIQYYRGTDDIEQSHDSLEDALFLKEVYDNIQQENNDMECPFPEYQVVAPAPAKPLTPSKKKSSTDFTEPESDLPRISAFKGGKYEASYFSWVECANALRQEEQEKCSYVVSLTEDYVKGVKFSIVNSITYNHKNYGRRWRVHGDVPKGEINV